MKKLFTFLLAFTVASSALAQSLVMEHDSTFCSGEAGYVFTCDNHVLNSTGINGGFKWTRYEIDMSPGWETTVCDKNNCYTATTSTKNFMMDVNENAIMKVNFSPNDVPGSGMVRINISSLDGTYATDSYFYGSTVTSTSTPTVQEIKDILLYPTPVRENVYVVFNPSMKPERLDVYNLLGQKVKSFPVQLDRNSFKAELQLADLDKGLYFIRVYQQSSNLVITKQFTKE